MIQEPENNTLPPDAHIGWLFGTLSLGFSAYALIVGSMTLLGATILLAVIFFAIAKSAPHRLRAANMLWMRLSQVLARVLSPIVLGALFFLVLTPWALVLKFTARDELRLRQCGLVSYWRERDAEYYQSRSFKDQF